jgi:hypothetical protein
MVLEGSDHGAWNLEPLGFLSQHPTSKSTKTKYNFSETVSVSVTG